ncbi:hypothetical protein [Massilia sp. S19_KUP03_FR1]|uniref:hypothetical protein n=1 Tax=Massilia sp. S19_KUP03_FR1 TaxID=3025503 RepID=UPI002FCD75E6
MLTATYTLVALSVEQTSVRVGLQSLRQMLHAYYLGQPALTAAQVEYAASSMQRLYDACHWRKLDKFLIPAVRRATRLADDLLAELGALSKQSADALAVSTAFGGAIDDSAHVDAFCTVVKAFCNVLLTRLEREEHDLFPLARAAVTGAAWFALANQMLAHDAYLQEHRCEPVPARNTHHVLPGRQVEGTRPGVRLSTLH